MMLVEERKLDLSEVKHEIAVLRPCVEELRKMSGLGGKRGRAARVALMLIEKWNIPVIDFGERCDEAIEEYSAREGCAVATIDEKLIKRLRMNRIEVLNIEGKILRRGD